MAGPLPQLRMLGVVADGVQAAPQTETVDGELAREVLEVLEVLEEVGVALVEEELQVAGEVHPITREAVVEAGARLIAILEGEGGTCKTGTLMQIIPRASDSVTSYTFMLQIMRYFY